VMAELGHNRTRAAQREDAMIPLGTVQMVSCSAYVRTSVGHESRNAEMPRR
jgi:hypothetical protein